MALSGVSTSYGPADASCTRTASSRCPRSDATIRVQAFDMVASPRQFERLNRHLTEGRIRVPITARYSLGKAAQAHRRLARQHVLGRMVLQITSRRVTPLIRRRRPRSVDSPQLRPPASDAPRDASDGSRNRGSRLEHRRNCRAALIFTSSVRLLFCCCSRCRSGWGWAGRSLPDRPDADGVAQIPLVFSKASGLTT